MFWIALRDIPSPPPNLALAKKNKKNRKKQPIFLFVLIYTHHRKYTRENYITNSCSLGHFYKKNFRTNMGRSLALLDKNNFFMNIGYSLIHFYKKNFLPNIGSSLGRVYKNNFIRFLLFGHFYEKNFLTTIKNFLTPIKKFPQNYKKQKKL